MCVTVCPGTLSLDEKAIVVVCYFYEIAREWYTSRIIVRVQKHADVKVGMVYMSCNATLLMGMYERAHLSALRAVRGGTFSLQTPKDCL